MRSVWAASNTPHSDIWAVSERSSTDAAGSGRRYPVSGSDDRAGANVAGDMSAVSHTGNIWASQRRWAKRTRRTPAQLRAQRFARSQSRARSSSGGNWAGRGRDDGANRRGGQWRGSQTGDQRYFQGGRGRRLDQRAQPSHSGAADQLPSEDQRMLMLNSLVHSLPDAPIEQAPTNQT